MINSKFFDFIVIFAALCLVGGILYLMVVIGHWVYDSFKSWCRAEHKEKRKK